MTSNDNLRYAVLPVQSSRLLFGLVRIFLLVEGLWCVKR